MKCPNCNSDKLRTYDNEALYHASQSGCEANDYEIAFDNEVHVSTTCDNCHTKGNMVGKITWEVVKPKGKTTIVYKIVTAMGGVTRRGDELDFLCDEEKSELNNVGYSGKLGGVLTSREKYLNSLNFGDFTVKQTKFDNGDFTEEFEITRQFLEI